METNTNPTWQAILTDAIAKPGIIHEAYSRFPNYSCGNQMLAIWQCAARGIEAGPIGTFLHWKDAGRFVRKGEKAIQLCMPVSCKGTKTVTAGMARKPRKPTLSRDSPTAITGLSWPRRMESPTNCRPCLPGVKRQRWPA